MKFVFKLLDLALLVILLPFCSIDEEVQIVQPPPFDIEILTVDSPLNFNVDKPWEKAGIGYINVIKTDSIWQLWYEAYDDFSYYSGRTDYNGYFCYATSNDGLNWSKPNVKLVSYKNELNNNILISNNGIKNSGIHGVTVFIDSLAPPSERYKMVYGRWVDNLSTNYIYGMTSPNGIHWGNERLLIKQYSDTQSVCFNDNGIYKLYLRYWNGGLHGIGYRQIGYSKSNQFNNSFSDYIPVNFFNGPDYKKLHIYNNAVNKINDTLYMCFPSIFNPKNDNMQITIGYNTKNDPTNFYFYNFDKTDIVEKSNSFRGLYAAPGLIKNDDKSFWLYYMATPRGHYHHRFPEYSYTGNIKRALVKIFDKK